MCEVSRKRGVTPCTRASSDARPQVLRIPNATGKEVFTGVRAPVSEKYDFRSFFIIGDRERLFRRIDGRWASEHLPSPPPYLLQREDAA